MVYFLRIMLFFLLVFLSGTLSAENRSIIGWIEPVRIATGNFILQAKIDTGAANSSLHSNNIEEFSRNGQPWVGFQVIDQSGKTYHFEQPVVRFTRIKRHGIEPQTRPVIHLGICLGKHFSKTEVNLTNIKTYKNKILIGRSFFQDQFLIYANAKNLTTPQCVTGTTQD